MAEPYVGQIIAFAGNFAIKGWAFCNGQQLPINQYSALFSILGTTYGGNGTTTFALPNLQGSFPMHFGGNVVLGQKGGTNSVSILSSNMPAHSHQIAVPVSNVPGTQSTPVTGVPAVPAITVGPRGTTTTVTISDYSTASTGQTEVPFNSGIQGQGIPITTTPPYVAVNFLIALVGVFPSRN
jgi:microcystin-dependent protein